MTKSKIFLFLLLAFIGGVGAGSFFDISEKVVLLFAIISLSSVVIFYRRGSRILNFPMALSAFLILTFSLGVLRFDTSEALTKALTNFNDNNVEAELVGYITSEPQGLVDKQRLTILVKEIRTFDYIVFVNEKVLITVNLYPEFEYGGLISVKGKLQSPKNFYPVKSSETGPPLVEFNGVNDFDYINYLAKDDIFSLSYYPEISKVGEDYFFKDDEISFLEKTKLAAFKPIFKFKNIFKDSISRSIAEPNASFINGILLGSRENIPQELKDAFSKTGTTHILAISGYNITIISLYVSFLLMFFMRRQTAFWVTLLAIFIFTILTGASASVIRAAIMGILVLLAYRQGRFYNAANSIVFAGAVMIFLNPKVLRFDVGFQLSFLATLGLIYLGPFFKEKLERVPEFLNFKENLVATLSAQTMVLPIILYNFGNFSIFSIPANVLILPVIPLTMLFGFLSGILGMVWSRLGEVVGLAAWLLAEYEILIVKLFSNTFL